MNITKKLTCVVCPVGCSLEATLDENNAILSITGNTCPRGRKYAESELTHPVRTLTTTVSIRNAEECRLPVKTDSPISREKLLSAMQLAQKIVVSAPISRGDVIQEDFTESGVRLIACKTIKEKAN